MPRLGMQDLSDRQWREFRSHLPTLLAMVAVHLGASKLVGAVRARPPTPPPLLTSART